MKRDEDAERQYNEGKSNVYSKWKEFYIWNFTEENHPQITRFVTFFKLQK